MSIDHTYEFYVQANSIETTLHCWRLSLAGKRVAETANHISVNLSFPNYELLLICFDPS